MSAGKVKCQFFSVFFPTEVIQALTRCSKSPIEKRKRNLNFFSPFSRRESDFLVSRFERRKRNYKKYSPLSRREREIDFLFSRFERRTRNSKKHSPLSRREREIIFERRTRNIEKNRNSSPYVQKRVMWRGWLFKKCL